MADDKYLTYRGDITAAATSGSAVLFVTSRGEKQPAALYRLDAQPLAIAELPLPAAAVDVVVDGDFVVVACADRRLYRGLTAGAKLVAVGPVLEAEPSRLAVLSNGRLAAVTGQKVAIVSTKQDAIVQTFDLPEPGTAIAADPTGQWLAVGTAKGNVLIFDGEGRPDLLLSESAKLHEGAVTRLLFEPDDLRLLSAGADAKLLSTHARGKLEPEDKGRGNNHTDVVTALVWGPADRLLSGSRDGTVKNWPRVGAMKPATVRDGVIKVVAMGIVQVHNRTALAAAGEDDTVRLFPIDAAGKVGDLAHRVHGAAAWAANELASAEVGAREAALRQLAGWDDGPSLEAIAKHLVTEADHGLRLLATQLIAGSSSAVAPQLLEKPLRHRDEAVRIAAFEGLRRLRGERDLRPLDLALAAEKADIGTRAVGAMETLAAQDDLVLARLKKALDLNPFEVRQAALASLERVIGAGGPEASLATMGATHADVRRSALVRLHRRAMLDRPTVQTALRRATEGADPDVRRVAFVLSLLTRPALAAALRARDADVDRQLSEIESNERSESPAAKPARESKAPNTTALR